MKNQGVSWSGSNEVSPHPMQAGRRTPLKLLMKKLGVVEYDVPSRFVRHAPGIRRVRLPLQQHIGNPALPEVRVGQSVKVGDLLGEIPAGKLSARVHASIDGVVSEVSQDIVIEAK